MAGNSMSSKESSVLVTETPISCLWKVARRLRTEETKTARSTEALRVSSRGFRRTNIFLLVLDWRRVDD